MDCIREARFIAAAGGMRAYSESLRFDADALAIANTFEGSKREFFLEDDEMIKRLIP